MHAPDEKLPVFHGAERILEVHRTGPYRLYLCAEKLNARFKAFKDEVVVERLAVLRYLFYALSARHGLAPFNCVS